MLKSCTKDDKWCPQGINRSTSRKVSLNFCRFRWPGAECWKVPLWCCCRSPSPTVQQPPQLQAWAEPGHRSCLSGPSLSGHFCHAVLCPLEVELGPQRLRWLCCCSFLETLRSCQASCCWKGFGLGGREEQCPSQWLGKAERGRPALLGGRSQVESSRPAVPTPRSRSTVQQKMRTFWVASGCFWNVSQARFSASLAWCPCSHGAWPQLHCHSWGNWPGLGVGKGPASLHRGTPASLCSTWQGLNEAAPGTASLSWGSACISWGPTPQPEVLALPGQHGCTVHTASVDGELFKGFFFLNPLKSRSSHAAEREKTISSEQEKRWGRWEASYPRGTRIALWVGVKTAIVRTKACLSEEEETKVAC